MARPSEGTKDELKFANRQLATVIDLNKCMGCQTCTIACKGLWTDRRGTGHMRWMNVTTYPGRGYPKDYEKLGGGYKDGQAQQGTLTNLTDCGDDFTFNHEDVLYTGKGQTEYMRPQKSAGGKPEWGYNWDEDGGGGEWPNGYLIYLPRMCYHCSNPACLDACPNDAIYKREEDGIVVLDQDLCKGHRHCVEACPYKAVYFNPETEKSEKCILCFPRVDLGIAPACNRQCVGRTRAFGYLDDQDSQVYQLVKKWQVALPLHPEYGTGPNVYYIPPWSPQAFDDEGNYSGETRLPIAVLEDLFGPEVHRVMSVLQEERHKKSNGGESELMDLLISRVWKDRFGGFTEGPLVQQDGVKRSNTK